MLRSIFDLPINIESDNEYLQALKSSTENIKAEYKKIINDDNKDKINDICRCISNVHNEIKKIFKLYYSGDMISAIKKMRNLIRKFHFFVKSPIESAYAFTLSNEYLKAPKIYELYLFKGRITNDSYNCFKPSEMHQIPLNRRDLISAQRFSIPGLPCLYLANNSFVVWNELKKPNFPNIVVSTFKILDLNKKIIDMTYPYSLIMGYIKKHYLNINYNFKEQDIINTDDLFDHNLSDKNYNMLAAYWPLLASISVHCRQKGRSFKSEYIIPQLMMHCLEDCVGIAYRSNAMFEEKYLPRINLAIPILKYNDGEKYGDIKEYIKVSEPVNFGYFYNVIDDKNVKYNPISSFNLLLDKIKNTNTYDLKFVYKNSLFYRFDEYLVRRDMKNIKENNEK